MKRRERVAELAQQVLAAGFAVIVDATFLQRRNRQRFYRLAAERQLRFAIIECMAPPEEVRRRLQTREKRDNDASEAGVRVMQAQLASVQPLDAEERRYAIAADSSESESDLWQRLENALKG